MSFVREPIRTRKQSATQERRNSVSDIKEYFQSKNKDDSLMSTSTKKTHLKAKDKERAKEAKIARENIIEMIKGLDNNKPAGNEENANGDMSIEDLKHVEQTSDDSNEGISADNLASTPNSQDEILSAISELLAKYKRLEDVVEDPKNGLSAQLGKTQSTVSQLYSDINGAVSGLKVQMAKVTEIAEQNSKNIQKILEDNKQMAMLLDENKRLVQELKIMQGLVQKVFQQTTQNANQILDVTKRGMEQNLLLHGIDNSLEIEDAKRDTPMFNYKERCVHSALGFFKDVMGLDLEPADIWKAHRTGPRQEGKVRTLIVKVSYAAKDLIMENVFKLKDKINPVTKQKYFVGEQVPDGFAENKKQINTRLKTLKDNNDKKPKEDRNKIVVVNNTILVNDKVDTPEVTTPQPSQLFLDPGSQREVDQVQSELIETEPMVLRNSEFIGLAAHANTVAKVQKLYTAVVQRYPSVDHAMMAYAFKEGTLLKTGSCDDREFGAGARLKKTIFSLKAKDTVVFVLRKYGGVHLGFNRFGIIEQVAKDAILQLG